MKGAHPSAFPHHDCVELWAFAAEQHKVAKSGNQMTKEKKLEGKNQNHLRFSKSKLTDTREHELKLPRELVHW